MNDILRIKGQFGHNIRKNNGGAAHLPANAFVSSEHISNIIELLKKLQQFWAEVNTINGALICVEYNRVVSKSNRIRRLLTDGTYDMNACVVGAKFNKSTSFIHHVITYFIPKPSIIKTIVELEKTNDILSSFYNGKITTEDINEINKSKNWSFGSTIGKTIFVNLIVDSFYVDSIYLPNVEQKKENSQIVTLYDVDKDLKSKLTEFGITLSQSCILNRNTFILDTHQYNTLFLNAPYLISMAVSDLAKMEPIDANAISSETLFTIPDPQDEPVIGVIDSFFDNNVYFNKWVDVKDIATDMDINEDDRFHGTAIDSLIVDGHRINPMLDDGCGNFRVRHFSVTRQDGYNSVWIISKVKEIIAANPDIKVWNFSLGSIYEIEPNCISYEAAELDKLQSQYKDIVIVVSGTNDKEKTMQKRIGAPADSINSLVVNAVDFNRDTASYSRRGPVLSFYNKPDISYYGGDTGNRLRACIGTGEIEVAGTSFAAPYISRKLAFLIYKMGLPREIAKALIVDSSIGWRNNASMQLSDFLGMGIVPIRIEDILQSKDDEIRFVISGEATTYDNYLYRIPVPISKEKQPYIAKATLCYFCEGDRSKGVDYTNTELDLHFGRITKNGIKTINDNVQNTSESRVLEATARSYFRKWDNIKVICEKHKKKNRPKELYQKGFWGISIKRTTRNESKPKNTKFGLVITLKNTIGDNLIDDFIQKCYMNELLVSRISIEQNLKLYNKFEEEVILE